MRDRVLNQAVKPVVQLARSVLGTNGLYAKSLDIEAKLDMLSAPQLAPDPPAQAAPVVPVASVEAPPAAAPMTKMEALAALLAHGADTYASLTGDPPPVREPAIHGGGSRLCRQGDFSTDAFRYWIGRTTWPFSMHRKLWEWFLVADALWSRGVLRPGSTGLGFGVGTEPLTSLFASVGSRITATDLGIEATSASQQRWMETNQHAGDLNALFYPDICGREAFFDQVSFRPVDMNDIPDDLTGFDFNWSACSLEHLGSLQHGIDFVVRSVDCLRPGGLAIHTTEFNLSSNTDTFEQPELSIYRRRDIEALIATLEGKGHRVEPVDWNQGTGFADGYVDLPPYSAQPHLRLRLAEYDCTSIGLIIHAKA